MDFINDLLSLTGLGLGSEGELGVFYLLFLNPKGRFVDWDDYGSCRLSALCFSTSFIICSTCKLRASICFMASVISCYRSSACRFSESLFALMAEFGVIWITKICAMLFNSDLPRGAACPPRALP